MRADSYRDKGFVRVIFRVFKAGGDVIAVFPDLPGDSTPGSCLSYQHIGQHGAADLRGVLARTRPATYRERDALRAELQAAGYKLVERVRYVRLKGGI